MSTTFKPKHVPADVIAHWPQMALSLWKRSFSQQAAILLAAAMATKAFPFWSTIIGFLIAPSLFIVSFAAVQIADERATFSWTAMLDEALPGALRMGQTVLRFAAMFGLGLAALAGLSSALVPHPDSSTQVAATDNMLASTPAGNSIDPVADNLFTEFLHFCASWTEGVMAMVFLGMFMIAIYQGVFGAVLHAREGMDARASRLYGWQAWQVNSGSMEQALREATPVFWCYLAATVLAVICAFQTVYLSPVGLAVATYVPSLAYVAYRSIFLGRHENVPAAARSTARRTGALVLLPVRR